jgi:cytochrome c
MNATTTGTLARIGTLALWALLGTAQAQDATRGRELYEARCSGCHSLEADRIGPRHAGLFGRRAGGVIGFDYSPALAAAKIVWDARTLERWLADPEALIAGQRMNYRVNDGRDRADLIAFLRTAK